MHGTSNSAVTSKAAFEQRTYAKVSWRLMPLLFVAYVVAYLDRVNVGFAKLQMQADLQFSDTVYGFGAGVFFISYFLLEVPSNMALHRIGARIWIARIMITWGIISAATMFVTSPLSFYILRFLLGAAEAGFFPGIVLYLTYWYPGERRGRINAIFLTAIAISGVVGGPLSGWIMSSMAGIHGWAGWQWMFLLEGIPSVIVGIAVLLWLDDGIEKAKWLNREEKDLLIHNIAQEDLQKAPVSSGHGLTEAFGNIRVWILGLVYFGLVMGLYGVGFWLPTLIKNMGVTDTLHIGFLTAIPYGVTVIAMVLISHSSDRMRERRWHVTIPALVGAAGLVAMVLIGTGNTVLAMAAVTVATIGTISALPLFWSLPTGFLGGAAAATGIALINSLGNLSGFVSPFAVGWLKDMTGSTDSGLYLLAASLVMSGVLVITTMPAKLVNK